MPSCRSRSPLDEMTRSSPAEASSRVRLAAATGDARLWWVLRRPDALAASLLSWPIKGYQFARSGRPSPCRFMPSCSEYALDALQAHGATKGSWLTLRRLSRCHPWGGSGYDPVP